MSRSLRRVSSVSGQPVSRAIRPVCEGLEQRRLLALIVPVLNSLPGAPHTLYLDFDGAPAFDWATANGVDYITQRVHGAGNDNTPVPAMSMDADAGNFSAPELTLIRDIFNHVREKFSPFNINVTTVDPGALIDGQSMRILVGGLNSDWYGSGGGVANVGAYNDSHYDNTGFVWPNGLAPRFATEADFIRHNTAENIAHEAGHVFGLNHVRHNLPGGSVQEYYTGNGANTPIMGGSSNAFLNIDSNTQTSRAIWWNSGLYGQNNPDAAQDDLAKLYSVISTRPDDHGPSNGGPTLFTNDNQGNLSGSGVIGSVLDVDGFRFISSSTTASFTVTNGALGGRPATDVSLDGAMLLPRVELRAVGTNALISATITISANGQTTTLSTSNLTIGQQYAINVRGDLTYGSIGQYTVAGQLQAFAKLNNGVLSVTGFDNVNDDIQFDLYMLNGQLQLYVDDAINGNPSQVAAYYFPWSQINSIVISTRSGDDTVRLLSSLPLTPITLDMGSGFADTLDMRTTVGQADMIVSGARIEFSYTTINYNDTVERVIARGTPGNDRLYVDGMRSNLQMFLYGGAGNDTLTVTTTAMDVTGPGGSFFGATFYGEAGTDSVSFNDNSGTAGRTYDFDTTGVRINGGAILGGGPSFGLATHESVTVFGGSGNDTVNVHSWRAGVSLTVNGNDGNDALELSPINRNVPANFAYAGATLLLNFRGGLGVDSIGIHNDNTTTSYYYNVIATTIGVSNIISPPTPSPAFGLNVAYTSAEHITAVAGSANDGFQFTTTAEGSTYEMNGGLGNEYFAVGAPIGSQLTSGIRSKLILNGGGGTGDNLTVYDQSDTIGRTLHIDDHSIGAAAGDDLLGAGGFIDYAAISGPIIVNLGSGADTIYARPSDLAPITIRGNGPSVGEAVGDFLGLAFANIGDPTFAPGAPGAGAWSFSDRQPINFTGIDSAPVIDDLAPEPLAGEFFYNVAAQQVDFTFSEDVSANPLHAWFYLTNITAGYDISPGQMAMTYDTKSNVAHITFPGLPNGALPDGDYHVNLTAGYVDLFGNSSVTPLEFDFFILAGDANHDRTVGFDDLLTLAQNYGQSGMTFSGGDFNYDGTVGFDDLLALAQNYGTTLLASGDSIRNATSGSFTRALTLATETRAKPRGRSSLREISPFL